MLASMRFARRPARHQAVTSTLGDLVSQTTAPILLRHARVMQHAGAPLTELDVLIADGRLAEVAPELSPVDGAAVVDLSGHALLPGFFNAHYHSHDTLAKGMFDSMPLEEWSIAAGGIGRRRSLEEIRARTLLGAVECLRNGITTVQDFANLAFMDDACVDTMLDAYAEAGIRVVFAISVRDRSQLDTIPWSRELVPVNLHERLGVESDDPEGQLAFVEHQIDRRGDRGGLVQWALAASAPHRCSPSLLRGLADLAQRRSLHVYTHLYETRMQRIYARELLGEYGGSMVGYLAAAGLMNSHLAVAHGIWTAQSEIEQLADSGVTVILNLMSNLRLGSGVAPIRAYRRAGTTIALGCDNLSCSDVQNPFQAMKLFCLMGAASVHDAPSAVEALHAATIGGATSAGMADRLGAIAPGMLADLIAIDLADPAYRPLNDLARQLVFAESGRGVRHVWVAGRQVVTDGRCTTVDEEQLVAEVESLMPSVRRDIDDLQRTARLLRPALRQIRERAEALDVDEGRSLPT